MGLLGMLMFIAVFVSVTQKKRVVLEGA
jgi:hypothetical protein